MFYPDNDKASCQREWHGGCSVSLETGNAPERAMKQELAPQNLLMVWLWQTPESAALKAAPKEEAARSH